MTYFRLLVLAAALLATTPLPGLAQEAPPAEAFRTVHLTSLTPEQVAALQAWMREINTAIEKAGHKEVRYRLYKVAGKQSGKYEYMWESSWPSGQVYKKVHDSPEWKAVASKHAGLDELMKDEIYNRYVEVK
jgi:hypothetical protein